MKQVHIEEKHEAYFIYIVDQVDKDIVQRFYEINSEYEPGALVGQNVC